VRQSQRKVENYQEKYVEDASTPSWANGCDKCKFGLIYPPDPSHIPAPWYAARVAQAKVGRLTFCTCDAGQGYRSYLLRKYYDIKAGRDRFPNWEEVEDAAATPTVNGGA
jgi:hypothetical protein